MEIIASIKIDRLIFPPDAKPVLKNIDLQINRGDFIVITGDAASGKSVLLHTITGAVPHYYQADLTGKITLMGQDIRDKRLSRMSDYVGYMMQEPYSQIISLNVYEEVAFGLGNLEIPIDQIDQKVNTALESVGLSGFEDRQTTALSGGEAQRVVLASILALDTPILLLDQPTAELDPPGRHILYERLGQLNKTRDLTIVLVMDRIEEVLNYANKVVVIQDGGIRGCYSPAEYYQDFVIQRGERLKRMPAITANIQRSKELVSKISRVSYDYKKNLPGCSEIDLAVYRGDVIAVIGLNGSGKSTLAKLLIGLLKPSKGIIHIFGRPLDKKNLTEMRRHTGFMFQNPDFQIFASSLAEEVGFSLKLRGVEKAEIDQKVNACLEFVGLLDYKDMHPQRLSRGQRQLLALASILAGDPDFIIADEPTSGLDDNQGYLIMDKLFSLAQSGKTILFITHDLPMARIYSTRLVVMHSHHIYRDIPTVEIEQHRAALEAIGLDFENVISDREVEDGAIDA